MITLNDQAQLLDDFPFQRNAVAALKTTSPALLILGLLDLFLEPLSDLALVRDGRYATGRIRRGLIAAFTFL